MNKRNADKAERDRKEAVYRLLWESANEAGVAAAKKVLPLQMIVINTDGSLAGIVPDGEFGSATVILRATDPFAQWVAKSKNGERYPRHCVSVYVNYDFQMQRSRAYSLALVDVLRAAGVCVERVTERLD